MAYVGNSKATLDIDLNYVSYSRGMYFLEKNRIDRVIIVVNTD